MLEKIREKTILISNDCVAPNLYLATFKAPIISQLAHPGQYMNIFPASHFTSPRAFSFFGINPSEETVQVYYQLRGEGTHYMAEQLKIGDDVWMEGPCGDGFHYGQNKKTLIVGAGVGLAPMKCLVEVLQRHHQDFEVLIGARSENFLKILELFPKNVNYKIVTDDGSCGPKQNVLEALENYLVTDEAKTVDSIIACGPNPVLEEIARLGEKHKITVQSAYTRPKGCPWKECHKCMKQRLKTI
ncbi:dihydroorotate dehydrogenase electron transfer subunit [Entomoplasma freundtii]|uniref:Dihydroorotate dehydrogenase electron transfer subunit n=1 Tax=Entomoplasma freundtii TaxID=74700 RepID=A0A2K8NQR5_9MOLU|nr:dihydroorotate dehydrogenase [Entomoplasma freundtii]ATZ16127.1 dihydroorotate dehydrogenase electron transfer subunit [Entomoplasma freundtii]TDY56972.1 dihydroorotate dehydrogenase electron transfer subunit [Entomoplasma freundtii]